MDIRIGVTHTPPRSSTSSWATTPIREAQVRNRSGARRRRRSALADRRRGREIGVPGGQDRLHRDRPSERRPPDRLRRLSDPAVAERWSIDLLDRKLLFVTGKGGVGKTIDRRGARRAGRAAGQAHARLRGRRKGRPRADVFETAAHSSSPARSSPHVWAMSMDTEESLQRVPEPAAPAAARRSHRAAGPHVRLRRQRRARREGDPHRRQALLRGAPRDTTTSSWSMPRRRGTSSASSPRPPTIAELVQVGMVRDQTQWMLDILDDPARRVWSS